MTRAEVVLIYMMEFSDNGEPEGGELHRGTREDCERVRGLLPAIAYSGSRPLLHAYTCIVPASTLAAEARHA